MQICMIPSFDPIRGKISDSGSNSTLYHLLYHSLMLFATPQPLYNFGKHAHSVLLLPMQSFNHVSMRRKIRAADTQIYESPPFINSSISVSFWRNNILQSLQSFCQFYLQLNLILLPLFTNHLITVNTL